MLAVLLVINIDFRCISYWVCAIHTFDFLVANAFFLLVLSHCFSHFISMILLFLFILWSHFWSDTAWMDGFFFLFVICLFSISKIHHDFHYYYNCVFIPFRLLNRLTVMVWGIINDNDVWRATYSFHYHFPPCKPCHNKASFDFSSSTFPIYVFIFCVQHVHPEIIRLKSA